MHENDLSTCRNPSIHDIYLCKMQTIQLTTDACPIQWLYLAVMCTYRATSHYEFILQLAYSYRSGYDTVMKCNIGVITAAKVPRDELEYPDYSQVNMHTNRQIGTANSIVWDCLNYNNIIYHTP